MHKRTLLRTTALTLSGLLLGGLVQAQDFPPSKPVTLVVGFAAGGPTDVLARIIAQGLSKTLGQQVIVDNRAGGGGAIGAFFSGLIWQNGKGASLAFMIAALLALAATLLALTLPARKQAAPVTS